MFATVKARITSCNTQVPSIVSEKMEFSLKSFGLCRVEVIQLQSISLRNALLCSKDGLLKNLCDHFLVLAQDYTSAKISRICAYMSFSCS